MELALPSLPDLLPERLRRSRLLLPRYPGVALEVRDAAVAGVRVGKVKGRLTLAAHQTRPLPPAVVGAKPFQPMLEDPARLESELRAVVEGLGPKVGGRVSLALPDSLARVVVVELPEQPRRESQAKEMIHWKVRRTIPFRLEDAVVSYQPLGPGKGGYQVLAAVAHRRAVQQFETLLDEMGLRVGLVDLSSFSVYNGLRQAIAASVPAESDFAAINATEGYFTLMIFRGERPLFYRSKPYHVGGGFQGEESLRVVQRELRSSLSYYAEKLEGEGLARTFLRTAGIDHAALAGVLPTAGLGEVERADAQLGIDGLADLEADEADALLPALGLALGRRS